MSALDRAFIKAYGFAQPSVLEVHSHARPMAQPVIARSQVANPTRATVPAIDVAPSRTTTRKSVATAPLSQFVMAEVVDEPFSAGLEIDELNWPEACEQLLARAADEWSQFAEHLCEQIKQSKKCIAFTSCHRAEGRTTLALATARQMAARGLHTVVVDADFENPSLARNCGVSAPSGWGEVLDGNLALSDALICAKDDNITLLPWQGELVRTPHLAGTLRATTSFETLRENYDLIVIDMMPLATPAAVEEFAKFAQAVRLSGIYFVRDMRHANDAQLSEICDALAQAGIPVAGAIENFVSSPDQAASSDDPAADPTH